MSNYNHLYVPAKSTPRDQLFIIVVVPNRNGGLELHAIRYVLALQITCTADFIRALGYPDNGWDTITRAQPTVHNHHESTRAWHRLARNKTPLPVGIAGGLACGGKRAVPRSSTLMGMRLILNHALGSSTVNDERARIVMQALATAFGLPLSELGFNSVDGHVRLPRVEGTLLDGIVLALGTPRTARQVYVHYGDQEFHINLLILDRNDEPLLIVECDEREHKDREPIYDEYRKVTLQRLLRCSLFWFDPFAERFNPYATIGQLSRHISHERKQRKRSNDAQWHYCTRQGNIYRAAATALDQPSLVAASQWAQGVSAAHSSVSACCSPGLHPVSAAAASAAPPTTLNNAATPVRASAAANAHAPTPPGAPKRPVAPLATLASGAPRPTPPVGLAPPTSHQSAAGPAAGAYPPATPPNPGLGVFVPRPHQ